MYAARPSKGQSGPRLPTVVPLVVGKETVIHKPMDQLSNVTEDQMQMLTFSALNTRGFYQGKMVPKPRCRLSQRRYRVAGLNPWSTLDLAQSRATTGIMSQYLGLMRCFIILSFIHGEFLTGQNQSSL